VDIREAADVFAHSYVLQRSLARPAEVHRAGPLLVMRDSVPKKDPRKQEILAFDPDPAANVAAVRAYGPPHHALDIFTPNEIDLPALKTAYKSLGYRYQAHEPFMVFDLAQPLSPPKFEVRLATAEEAMALAKADRAPALRPEDIEAQRIRVFFAERDGRHIGGVRNFRVVDGASYVANMFVAEEHRRRGLATALMTALLLDARELGDRWSVLLASQMGHPLYRSLGYERIGTLHMLNPLKAKD
jgi:GNAT superfamily N-acetyltransferase